jgi:hypothetical protein
MKICPKCGIEHEKPGTFCSRSCANAREQSPETKARISKSLVGRANCTKGKLRATRVEKTCPECEVVFVTPVSSTQKYCCSLCARKNLGGYREGSGRAKTGYYRGFYCGSTYELCWLIYQLDHDVGVSRFGGLLESGGVKYIPDFIQDGKIVEIKGYENQDSVDRKTKVANECGYDVVVLRKDDLQHCFDWVRQRYGTNKYHELYDGYKPKYSHVCDHCQTEFETDAKITTNTKFCSRSCAGKYRKSKTMINGRMTDENRKKISNSLLRNR